MIDNGLLNIRSISQRYTMYWTKMENRGFYIFHAKFIIPNGYTAKNFKIPMCGKGIANMQLIPTIFRGSKA